MRFLDVEPRGGIANMRQNLARGMLINGTFQVGLLAVAAVRGFVVAGFLTRSDYGLWGLVGLTVWTAMALRTQFGAGDKSRPMLDQGYDLHPLPELLRGKVPV